MDATYHIAGKEYIAIDLLATRDNAKSIKYACNKYGTIDKEIKQFERGGLFKKGFVLGSVYVPLDKYKEFVKSINDKVTGEIIISGKSSTDNKNLMIVIIVGLISVVALIYVLKKHLPKIESEQKPNIFKRFKLWCKSKFSKKEDQVPMPAPANEEKKHKGLLPDEAE